MGKLCPERPARAGRANVLSRQRRSDAVLCLDKPVAAHHAWYQKNACGEQLPVPPPNHNCCNRAPEHNAQANFSMFWTSSVSIKDIRSCGIEALIFVAGKCSPVDWMYVTAMPVIATLTTAEDHIKTNSIGLPSYSSDDKDRGQKKKTGKRWSGGVPCLDKPVLAQGGGDAEGTGSNNPQYCSKLLERHNGIEELNDHGLVLFLLVFFSWHSECFGAQIEKSQTCVDGGVLAKHMREADIRMRNELQCRMLHTLTLAWAEGPLSLWKVGNIIWCTLSLRQRTV